MNRHGEEIAFPLTLVVHLAHGRGIAATATKWRCDFIHGSYKSLLNSDYEIEVWVGFPHLPLLQIVILLVCSVWMVLVSCSIYVFGDSLGNTGHWRSLGPGCWFHLRVTDPAHALLLLSFMASRVVGGTLGVPASLKYLDKLSLCGTWEQLYQRAEHNGCSLKCLLLFKWHCYHLLCYMQLLEVPGSASISVLLSTVST